MVELNGHALEPIEPQAASAADLDALLSGLFEPVLYPLGNGQCLEIRTLMVGQADALFGGGLSGAEFQRYLLAHCVYVGGRPIGEAGAARLPLQLANRLRPILMAANNVEGAADDDDQARAAAVELLNDPKE